MVKKNRKLNYQNPPRTYSEQFKRLVVAEYEQGFLNKDQIQRKYDIRGNETVNRWLRRYGKFDYPKYHSHGRPMKDPDKQRIKELEAQLKTKEFELDAYKRLMEIAERELNIKIVKKSGTKQSENMRKKGSSQ
ncbi:MAG: transposase [Bacteroidota bacterium]